MTFSPAEWWGRRGCRFAGQAGHICVDVFGHPLVVGRPCVAEARAAMGDLFATYRAVPA